MVVKKEIQIGNKTLSFETGRFARQADGAVMARYADTMVLATVVAPKESEDDLDYFPLQVEYREKMSSAGKIPGGFLKREGRPSDKEILSSRLIDRPIRPMFPGKKVFYRTAFPPVSKNPSGNFPPQSMFSRYST